MALKVAARSCGRLLFEAAEVVLRCKDAQLARQWGTPPEKKVIDFACISGGDGIAASDSWLRNLKAN